MGGSRASRGIVALFFLLLPYLAWGNDLVIESFSIQGYQRNAAAMGAGEALAYLRGRESLAVDLDLKLSWDCAWVDLLGVSYCSGSLTKPSQVEVQILLTDSAGTVILPLGTVSVAGSDIALRNYGGVAGNVTSESAVLRFTLTDTAAFHQFAVDHPGARFRVEVDPNNLIAEGSETNNQGVVGDETYRPLTGSLRFGPVTTTISTLGGLIAESPFLTDSCSFYNFSTGTIYTRYRLSGGNYGIWAPALSWSLAPLSLDGLCTDFAVSADGTGYDVMVTRGNVQAVTGGTVGSGLEVQLSAILSATGASGDRLLLALPSGVTWHPNRPGGTPERRGSRELVLTKVSIASTGPQDGLTASVPATQGWVTAEGWSFSLAVTDLTLDKTGGVSGKYGQVRHHGYALPYATDDPRHPANSGPVSNDGRWALASTSQPNTGFLLDANGIEVPRIEFEPGKYRAHYPKVVVRADTRDAVLARFMGGYNPDYQPLNTGVAFSATFDMDPRCAGCVDGGATVAYALTSKNAGFAGDGSLFGLVSGIPDPAWGSWDATNGRHIFERQGDAGKTGVFYLPGHVALGTEKGAGDAIDYLLGVRRPDTSGSDLRPGILYPLGDRQERDGNYFPAGLTVGPERYQGGVGLPVPGIGVDLAGTVTRIGFGGPTAPDYQDIVANAATRYVVRPGGITGVFNTDTPPSTVKAYGYTLALHRFAFRQVANRIDESSWIDGSISIPGKGDFGVVFSSLGLDCTGGLSSGAVEREACDGSDNNGNGIVDENCGERLAAWNLTFEPVSLAFVPESATSGMCTVPNRVLQVGKVVHVRALDKPLGILARWSPVGEPSGTRVRGDTDHVLDRPTTTDPDKQRGFGVALDENFELKVPPTAASTGGWLETPADIAVPFWDNLAVDLRLANRDMATPEQTIVRGRGMRLTANDDAYTNAQLMPKMEKPDAAGSPADAFQATYTWGRTGFSLGLPIYYEADRLARGEPPRFLGRKKSVDLMVLQLGGGIQYLDPRATRVNFGASAEFEKLKALSVDLSVDLRDPESVVRVDDFLCNPGGVCSRPVGALVSQVQGVLGRMNDFAGSGLADMLHDAVHQGLEDAMNGISPDPFAAVSDTLARVQALPGQIETELTASMLSLVDRAVNPLTSELDGIATDLYRNLPAVYIGASASPADIAAVEEVVNRIVTALDDVSTVIGGIETAARDTRDRMANLQNRYASGANNYIGQTEAAIDTLYNALNSASDLASCDINRNAVLGPIEQVRVRLSDVRNVLDSVDLGPLVTELVRIGGIDREAANAANRVIRQLTEETKPAIDEVLTRLQGVCTDAVVGAGIPGILDDAKTFVQSVRDAVTGARAALASVNAYVNTAGGWLDGMVARLTDVRRQIDNTAAGLRRLADLRLTFTAEADMQAYLDSLANDLIGMPWYDSVTGRSFVPALAASVRQPVDSAVASLSVEVRTRLEAVISVIPQPTAEELRLAVIGLVMNSPVMETVDDFVYEATADITQQINDLVLQLFDQVNYMLSSVLQQIEEEINGVLQAATSEVNNAIPIKGAELDGYAVIAGDDLERLHVASVWTLKGDSEDSTSEFRAALDVVSWNANGKAQACGGGGADLSSRLDARITATALPISVGPSDATIRKAYLGFILDGGGVALPLPQGVFGGIELDGTIYFEAIKLYDIAFAAGVTPIVSSAAENYLGATAAASMESIQMEAAFLVGRTCNSEVLESLDPEAAEFITLPGGLFNGVYARGSASVPILEYGCTLRVTVGADVGSWVLIGPPLTIGGLVGGSASGKVACLAALRGQVTAYGEKSGDRYRFRGDGFGVGGLGIGCEPETWTSIPRSREDDWCGTGDAYFSITFDNGSWIINGMDVSAIY